jgi:hypothetical protein
MVDGAVMAECRDHAGDDGDGQADHRRNRDQDDGIHQSAGDVGTDRLLADQGTAEIAMQQADEPVGILTQR